MITLSKCIILLFWFSFPGTGLELVQDNAIQIYPSLVLVPAYLEQGSFQLSRSRSSLSRILDKLVPAILVPAGASFQILVPARSSLILVPVPRSSSFPRSSPSFQLVPV